MNQDITQQTVVEMGMFKMLMEGLRTTLAWKVQGNDFSRKLSTVRFMVQSFQRHQERLFALEEYDGYMSLVEQNAPQLSRTVDALKQQHEKFRIGARRISHALERIASTDAARFACLCDDMLELLDGLEQHNKKEAELFQEAMERDSGGEG